MLYLLEYNFIVGYIVPKRPGVVQFIINATYGATMWGRPD